MPAPIQQRPTATLAALVGTTLLAGCALPRMSELSNRRGINNSIPTVINKDRPLEASPGIRPFCSGLAVSSEELARALDQITMFRLEHLNSITLGPDRIELMKNGEAKLSIRVNETSTSSVDGEYRLSTVELTPGRWERVIEISGAGFLKGEAVIRLSETDPVAEGQPPAFSVDARFSPYFPASLILDGMTTGGPVPVYFRDSKTVRTDTIWAYSLLGSGAVEEAQFVKVRDALKQLDETATVSLGRWSDAVPSPTQEQIDSFERALATEKVATFIRIDFSKFPERPESRQGVISFRVAGIDQDFVYLSLPPWERLLKSSILLSVDTESGIFALPVDCTWSPAYDGSYQRAAPERYLESSRPLYTSGSAAIPERLLSAITAIDTQLVKLESGFGLPIGYHEISIIEKVRPLREHVATTGRIGGNSTLVVSIDRTDEIAAEPRTILAHACRTLIQSITGGNVPGVNHPLSPQDAQFESEKIWPRLSPVLREAQGMAAQVVLALYDEKTREELRALGREERRSFARYADRVGNFLKNTTLSIGPEVFAKLGEFSVEFEKVSTNREELPRAKLGDLRKLILDSSARTKEAAGQLDVSIRDSEIESLINKGAGWAFGSLSKFVDLGIARGIGSSAMKRRLSREGERLRKRGITFSERESEDAVLYSLFSIGGVPVQVTEKLPPHWASAPEVFRHILKETPLARMELGSTVNSVILTGRVWNSYSSSMSPAQVFISTRTGELPELIFLESSDSLADSAVQGMKMTGDFIERTEYFTRLKEEIAAAITKLLTPPKS